MGTTWVAKLLSFAPGLAWINEPDNDGPEPFGFKAKLSLGRFPILEAGEPAPSEYQLLWERAFSGFRQRGLLEAVAKALGTRPKTRRDLWRAMCDHANPRVAPWLRVFAFLARPPSKRESGDQVMVKSVHAALALEWLAARFRPRILLVLRHPLNVIASWMELGWGGHYLDTHPKIRERYAQRWEFPELPGDRSPLAAVTWEVALFVSVLNALVEQHPDWLVVTHEDLCLDPAGAFRHLYASLGLTWTDEAEGFLVKNNRPGSGYVIARVAVEQPERWRKRLTAQQIDEIWSLMSRVQAPWVERVAKDLDGSSGR